MERNTHGPISAAPQMSLQSDPHEAPAVPHQVSAQTSNVGMQIPVIALRRSGRHPVCSDGSNATDEDSMSKAMRRKQTRIWTLAAIYQCTSTLRS